MSRSKAAAEIAQEMSEQADHELRPLFGSAMFAVVLERLIEQRQVEMSQRPMEVSWAG